VFKNSMKRSITTFAVAAAIVATSVAPAFATTTVKLSGSTTVQPLAVALGAAFMKINKSIKVTVTGGGSGVGRNDITAKTVDLGMASSQKSDAAWTEIPIARDALTVITNTSNKVKAITTSDLRKIYSGQITNWSALKGANAKINVYGRAAGSGTAEYFNGTVLGNVGLIGTLKTKASSTLMKNAVAGDKNGIGYVGMSYATSKVRGLYVDGVQATRPNAIAGKYKWVRFLYLLKSTSAGAYSADAKKFVDFTLSAKGQVIVNSLYIKLR
jgi:phosphate transport system substrate-binding protein